MNRYYRLLALAVVVSGIGSVLSSCLKLDPFLFKGKELSEYRLDAYTDKQECADAVDSLGPVDLSSVSELSIPSGDDALAAILIAPDTAIDSSDTMIVYFHGTGPHIDYYWPRTRLLEAVGYPVLAIDYRGYGKSTGTPTEKGIYEDGAAALHYIRTELGNPQVVVYSFSLGTLVGCDVAAHDSSGRVIALVLEAPIGKLETMVQDAAYIDLPGSYVITYEGNNVEKIADVHVPLLWLHGTADETNTYETNGKKVFANYRGPDGYCWIVDGAGHRTIPSVIGYNDYLRGVGDFIRGNAADNTSLTREPRE